MTAEPAYDSEIVRLVAAAFRVTQVHQPASDGFCAGCLALWGHLAWYPCTQTQWAKAVLAQYTATGMDNPIFAAATRARAARGGW